MVETAFVCNIDRAPRRGVRVESSVPSQTNPAVPAPWHGRGTERPRPAGITAADPVASPRPCVALTSRTSSPPLLPHEPKQIMQKVEWTKEVLTRFIEIYREKRCLWDTEDANYLNKYFKRHAYGELVGFLKGYFPNADEFLAKAKIQNIRSAFRKENRKIAASKKSGVGPFYSPSLWYYDLLLFTIDPNAPKIVRRNSSSSENDSDGDREPQLPEVLDSLNRTDSPPPDKQRKLDVEDDVFEFMKVFNKALHSQPKPTEFDAVGINFASKLKRMTKPQQIFAEALMQKVLTKGLLNGLSEYTDVIEKRAYIQ